MLMTHTHTCSCAGLVVCTSYFVCIFHFVIIIEYFAAFVVLSIIISLCCVLLCCCCVLWFLSFGHQSSTEFWIFFVFLGRQSCVKPLCFSFFDCRLAMARRELQTNVDVIRIIHTRTHPARTSEVPGGGKGCNDLLQSFLILELCEASSSYIDCIFSPRAPPPPPPPPRRAQSRRSGCILHFFFF